MIAKTVATHRVHIDSVRSADHLRLADPGQNRVRKAGMVQCRRCGTPTDDAQQPNIAARPEANVPRCASQSGGPERLLGWKAVTVGLNTQADGHCRRPRAVRQETACRSARCCRDQAGLGRRRPSHHARRPPHHRMVGLPPRPDGGDRCARGGAPALGRRRPFVAGLRSRSPRRPGARARRCGVRGPGHGEGAGA